MTEFERLFQSKDAVIVQLCPRWLHEKARKCLKPLTDYKCPQHGLIREVMPETLAAERAEAIRRLAVGIDIPAELLTHQPGGHYSDHMRGYLEEFPDPEPDDVPIAELGEYDEMWTHVHDALQNWRHTDHRPRRHGVGTFLDFLAARGYRVTPIEPPPKPGELLPPATD